MSVDRSGGDGPGLFAPGPAAGVWRTTPDALPDPPCRHDAKPTSREAARSMKQAAPPIRERVRRFILDRGRTGATAEEASIALGLRMSTASARFRELAQAQAIRDSGRTRPTTSGRAAVVWLAGDEGVGDG